MTDALDPFVRLALGCVHREYPSHVSLRLTRDDDLQPPRELTPAFYGCFDWHSAVHGHWLLARAIHFGTGESEPARLALAKSLTIEKIARELLYLGPRPGFERPYGLSWLLALHAELATSKDDALRHLGRNVAPLAALVGGRWSGWLEKLAHPIRSGVHSQTAFAMGLALDWARATGEMELRALIERRALDYHERDRDLPLHLEPSGEDFLSPALGVADLMRRVLDSDAFSSWLTNAMPTIHRASFAPAEVSDPNDGRLAHLDGLNLSRAWMLHAIGAALPGGDERRPALAARAVANETAGLAAIRDRPYEGTHWLGTFATYLITHESRPRAAGTR